jgi:hypothetical protein
MDFIDPDIADLSSYAKNNLPVRFTDLIAGIIPELAECNFIPQIAFFFYSVYFGS